MLIPIAPAARQVSQLVPRLGIGTDLEIADAAREISAVLAEHDLDLVDLAAFVRGFAPRDGALVAEQIVFECLPYAQLAAHLEHFLIQLAGETFLGPLRLSPDQWKRLREAQDLIQFRRSHV